MTASGPYSVLDGVLLVDKPRGITSHGVVARMRRLTGIRRIGHTGTLDPLATGLLVISLGSATRISQFLTGLDKIYTGVITLGAISSTYDAEGDITEQHRPLPSEADLRNAMAILLGEKIQLPPPFSAVKVAGKKLYQYARNGEPIPPKPRWVRILRFDLVRYIPPRLEFVARVGSGTYIRSMAHDIGLTLDCGAYLSALNRIQVGAFSIDNAVPLDDLENDPDLLAMRLLGVTEALGHLPKITLMPAAARAVQHGCSFSTSDILEFEGLLRAGEPVLVLDELGRVLSVARGWSEKITSTDHEQSTELMGSDVPLVFKPLRVLAQPYNGSMSK